MALNTLTTTVHVCEDINEQFDITQLLVSAGYTPTGQIRITSIAVEQNGDIVAAPTPLIHLTNNQTIEVTAANVPNYNGNFSVFTVSVDVGNGEEVVLEIQTIIDPVNDAPDGLDKSIDLVDASPYILSKSDFGFQDVVEHNGFKSVLISALPASGKLLLDGQALAAGTDVSVADIDAGKLSYVPSQNASGITQFGFQVRDDGGNADPDCGGSDLDLTPNYLTFKVPFAALGDTVFNDNNRNGVQDAGDTGQAGVTVTLHGAGADGTFGTADDTTATTATDANGQYHFTGLNAGQYKVEFSGISANKTFTFGNRGSDDTIDSDVVTPLSSSSGQTDVITLTAGQTNNTVDAGLVTRLSAIGDTVWFDRNANGILDPYTGNDTYAPTTVTVTLHGAGADGQFGTADDITKTTTTDLAGQYLFDKLEAGRYQVEFTNPDATRYAFSTQHVGSDTTVDSDADANGLTQVFELVAGKNNFTIDAGLVLRPASVGDTVFIDKNGNGVQDAGEAGVAGAKVTLTGAGLDGAFGTADDTTDTTTTDANGKYVFNNVAGDQDYKVSVSNTPAGYAFTAQAAGADRTVDSDVDASGTTASFHLNAGQSRTDIDAGLVAKAGSIGDFVFIDKNGNGVQDAGEAGVAGAKVTLTGAGLDGVFGTADDSTVSTSTDANGKYVFNNVAGDQDYKVQFSNTPAGYDFTTQAAGGNTALDSDANASGLTNSFHLNAGQTRTDIDAGLVARLGSIGNFVWLDANGNGLQDSTEAGIAGITVKLTGAGADGVLGTADDTTATTTTSSTGAYLFGGLAAGAYTVAFSGISSTQGFTTKDVGNNASDTLDSDVDATGKTGTINLGVGENNLSIDAGVITVSKPTACVGDRVWYDDNKNGLQDSCENGVAGVTVKLIGAGADGTFGTADDTSATTTTDSCGYYKFSGLYSGQQYQLQFGTKNGYGFTTQDVGTNDACDSDANKTTGLTKVFTLADGECNTSYDAGLVCRPTACVGDRVWNDTNHNGLQDSCEGGLAGVTVTLTGAGADGVWGNADDVCLSTTTDCNGAYKFSGLIGQQQYQLQFGTLTGYGRTLVDVGTNDACDSDADLTTGKTKVFTLADGECNTSYDAGLYCRPTACVGDRVWNDANHNGLQDSCEGGLAGVKVTLTGAGADGIWGNADDVCLSTTTDCNGAYKFSGLIGQQQYQLQFGTLTGYGRTLVDVGTNDACDSDADITTGLTKVFTLADGECNTSYDAGLYCRPTATVGDRVWLDCNGNGIQDCNEAGASGVTVTLTGAGNDGVWGTADDICKTTTTDCNGAYKFAGLAGEQQYQLQFGTLYGYSRTAQDVGTNDSIDSDANVSTGLTKVFTLHDGDCVTNIDAGLVCKPTACVGDRVWLDTNGNGLQDSGECGVSGVKVTLTGAGQDGVWGSADDICKTTTTDCNGAYSFTGLVGGEQFKLQFGAVCGYTFTAQDKGTNDAIDSDVDANGLTKAFTLAAGECNTSIDAGLFKNVTASLVGCNTVYEGCSTSYQVKLSSAVAADTWITVSALDGSAHRTSVDASCQNLYGVNAQTNDYALIGTDCKIDADGIISVKIAAGQTCSTSFSVTAWQEKVTVDLFTYLCGGYKEAAWENLNLHLSGSTNAQVDVGCDLTVSIGDTSCYALSSPIALDLDGNGIHTTALVDSKGTFDLLGNGHAVNSGWLSAGDAFLAIDNNGNGKIDSISEMFGGNKGDGFAKLASFDTNHDGLVDAKDADFGKLLVWQDLNGDHATDAGELRTLGEAGIASLSTGFTDGAVNQLGNVLGETSVATRTDGSHITTTDVYFNTDVDGASLPQLASLLSSTNTLLDNALGTAAAPAAPAANDAAVTADAETLRQLAALLEQQHHAVAA